MTNEEIIYKARHKGIIVPCYHNYEMAFIPAWKVKEIVKTSKYDKDGVYCIFDEILDENTGRLGRGEVEVTFTIEELGKTWFLNGYLGN